jgi:hypothetical protein
VAAVLRDHAAALRLDADEKVILAGARDQRRRALDELRGGGHARELQRREFIGDDLAIDAVASRVRVALQLHVGVAHQVGPERRALARGDRFGAEGAGHAPQHRRRQPGAQRGLRHAVKRAATCRQAPARAAA